MSVARFEIVKLFSDPTYLFFEHGVTWGGDVMNGVCVLYRLNGHVQELVTDKHGELEGLRATYHPSGSPRSFRHYRKGRLFGEALAYDRAGAITSHVFFTGHGEEVVDYRPDLEKEYAGYLMCQQDLDTEKKYWKMGPRGWTE